MDHCSSRPGAISTAMPSTVAAAHKYSAWRKERPICACPPRPCCSAQMGSKACKTPIKEMYTLTKMALAIERAATASAE